MKAAFRNLPIRPQDWKWLVMKAKHPTTGKTYYFYGKCVPFGLAISCCHFQKVSDAIEVILKFRSGHESNNYLDDFLFIAWPKVV